MTPLCGRKRESGQILIFAVLILVPLALAALHALVKVEARLETAAAHGNARAEAFRDAGIRADTLNRIAENNHKAAGLLKDAAEAMLRAASDGVADASLTSGYEDWPPAEGSSERAILDRRWRSASRAMGRLEKALALLLQDSNDALQKIQCPECEATLVSVDAGTGLCLMMALHPEWFERSYMGPARSPGVVALGWTYLFDPQLVFRLGGASSPCSLHAATLASRAFIPRSVLPKIDAAPAFLLPRPLRTEEFERPWRVERSAEPDARSKPDSLARIQERLLSIVGPCQGKESERTSSGPVSFFARVLHPSLSRNSEAIEVVRAGFDPRFVPSLWIEGVLR